MHLALINIAKAKYPMDDPRMSGFVNNLDAVNKAADRSPGFIWRLIDNVANSTVSIRAFEDPDIITNMAVWRDLESLKTTPTAPFISGYLPRAMTGLANWMARTWPCGG